MQSRRSPVQPLMHSRKPRPWGGRECAGFTASKRQSETQAYMCSSSPHPTTRVACLLHQMESDLGDRTTPGVILRLLAEPQSKSDFILYDSRYREGEPEGLFCFLAFSVPRRAGGCLVPGSYVGRVTHILVSPDFFRIWLGLLPSCP